MTDEQKFKNETLKSAVELLEKHTYHICAERLKTSFPEVFEPKTVKIFEIEADNKHITLNEENIRVALRTFYHEFSGNFSVKELPKETGWTEERRKELSELAKKCLSFDIPERTGMDLRVEWTGDCKFTMEEIKHCLRMVYEDSRLDFSVAEIQAEKKFDENDMKGLAQWVEGTCDKDPDRYKNMVNNYFRNANDSRRI